MRAPALFTTLALLAASASARAGTVQMTKGTVTFTQGGKQASGWALANGTLVQREKGQPPDVILSYMQDPKGATGGSLNISVAGVGAERMVTVYLFTGPSGDSWNSAANRQDCQLTLKSADEKGVKGTATCQDKTQKGAPEKISFDAAP